MNWRLPPRLRRWRLVWPDEAGIGGEIVSARLRILDVSP